MFKITILTLAIGFFAAPALQADEGACGKLQGSRAPKDTTLVVEAEAQDTQEPTATDVGNTAKPAKKK